MVQGLFVVPKLEPGPGSGVKMMRSACGVVILTAMFAAQPQAAPAHVLANEQIRVTISADGKLESVGNLVAAP
jgi:hypothetical protein